MKVLKVTMPDGSVWAVPLELVIDSYLEHYDDLGEEDCEVFRAGEADDVKCELKDWAAGNMDWSDVEARAIRVELPPAVDFQEGWVNGHKDIADMDVK